MTDHRLLISEIFYSLQGEGECAGVPSVFIRTSGCNLRCRWCDTKYASWEPRGVPMTQDRIRSLVGEHRAARHVVVTGGEPMVARGIRGLLERLKADGYHLTIETAATVRPEGVACDLASLSPKLSNSTPRPGETASGWIDRHEMRRFQPGLVRDWIDSYPYQLKFVVTGAGDVAEMESLLARIGREIPPHRVLLMPEGVDAEALRCRDRELIELCKERGYRYCPRLQIDWFGNTQGT